MKMRALLLVAALALSACASTARTTLTYRGGTSDADVLVGDQRFQVWFHERDRTVLVIRGQPRTRAVLMAENMTIYANDRSLGILWWGAAANAVLTQLGCYATEVTGADQMREVQYTCQQPVNVNREVAQRREEWRRGVAVPAPQEQR